MAKCGEAHDKTCGWWKAKNALATIKLAGQP